jgi:hypothetical protein
MAARIDSVKNLNDFPPLVKNVPPVWPTRPEPGKLSLLWASNYHDIYHKFSPYTTQGSFFGIAQKQPYIYKFIDDAKKSTFDQLPSTVKSLAVALNIPAAIDDTVRVSKFILSPQGLTYSLIQAGLQLTQPFDETRIYNPISPILAAIQPGTFDLISRPVRHIELSLQGVVNTLGLANLIQLPTSAPRSTVGDVALPSEGIGTGKGLLRGQNASIAESGLVSKWQQSPGGISSPFVNNLLGSLKKAATAFFGGFSKISGIQYRADEHTYDLMVHSKGKLKTTNKTGVETDAFQIYIAKEVEYEKFITDNGSPQLIAQNGFVTSKRPSTFNDPVSDNVNKVAAGLQAIISKLDRHPYSAQGSVQSTLLNNGEDPTALGINALMESIPTQYESDKKAFGVVGEYRAAGTKTVDASVNESNNLRIATSFKSDGMNLLPILKRTKNGSISIPSEVQSLYPGWSEYRPHEDDLISFFFYDVVNEKYIPFRATVKGISEGNTAYWDELKFIGRSDALYSYNGFTRTLSFTFNVVIGSVAELLPTWKKINYIASCVKPSNYTTGENVGQKYNRFIVPPMFMVTIGDMYKFQPIVVTSVNVNIPDDAAWETLNEQNAAKGWHYLNGLITATNGTKYSQLPKEAEIAITCNLLEKERAQVGGSHFGHSPRVDDWDTKDGDSQYLVGDDAFLPKPTEFSTNLIESNAPSISKIATPTPPATPFKLLSTPPTGNSGNGGVPQFRVPSGNSLSNTNGIPKI